MRGRTGTSIISLPAAHTSRKLPAHTSQSSPPLWGRAQRHSAPEPLHPPGRHPTPPSTLPQRTNRAPDRHHTTDQRNADRRSVSTPEQRRQLLAPRAHREPLGITYGVEAISAQVHVSCYQSTAPDSSGLIVASCSSEQAFVEGYRQAGRQMDRAPFALPEPAIFDV